MTAIDVSLAVDAGVQLPALDGGSLEIERPFQREQTAPWIELSHDHRLGQVTLRECTTVNRGRFAGRDPDCLRAYLEDAGSMLTALRAGSQGREFHERERRQEHLNRCQRAPDSPGAVVGFNERDGFQLRWLAVK